MSLKVNFVGDVGVFQMYEDLNIDPFRLVDLPEADLNIGNFEFISSKNRNIFFYDVQKQYSCSYNYLNKLYTNRFQGFGLANNHVLDYGYEGAKETIEALQKKGITTFGFSNDINYSIGEFSVKGIKLGIIACVKEGRWSKVNFGYGPDDYNMDEICSLITASRNRYDHLIIFPHWGTELIEIPEFKDTTIAKRFIDEGATAVIGHHPHISQGIEEYNGGLIAYSLGSFLYIHEEELGYNTKIPNRHISICLNITFDKKTIVAFHPSYYKYNKVSKLPEPVDDEDINKYAFFLNNNIYNQQLYKKQLIRFLLKREIISFFGRFKAKPVKTIVSYLKLIKLKHLKKIFSK